MTGPIPPTLAHGIYLFLDHNQLSGPIPPQISAVQVLSLSNNQLTGSIPATLFSLIWLHELLLDHNQLSGPIPPEIGNSPQVGNHAWLDGLDLSENQLTGPIPHQTGYLTRLEHLELAGNQLRGPIPAGIGNLSRLVELDLGGNQLSGPIPPQLGALGLLSTLHLQGNQLGGPIPAALTNLTGLVDGSSDLRWNALHTSDAALRSFLPRSRPAGTGRARRPCLRPASRPAALRSTASPSPGRPSSIQATRPGGPYSLGGTTAGKTVFASTVSGLSPGTTYYFALDTVTEPHANNPNTVVSERTAEVSARTTAGGLDWYALTVVRDGPGTVSSLPSGIACGGVCSATFAPSTAVTLTTSPDVGSTFLGWGGACAGTAPTCDLPMGATETVTASFSPPAVSLHTVAPCRVFDSRDAGLGGPGALAAGTDNTILIAGYCGIPSTAKAVSLNMTVVSPSAGGHLRLFASGTPRPTASTINYTGGQTRANNAVVSLGADASLTVYVSQPSGTTHLAIDVNGYFQ